MATYKEIKGTQIEAVATDPSNPVEGQVWYNTTSNVLKGLVATGSAAWATSNALNNARSSLSGQHTGTQTAAFLAGGATPDDSYIQSGQRPNGLPHQLRGEMNKLFQCEPSLIERLLLESMDYKPAKKKRVNLHMPDLSLAIEEVYRDMIRRDNSLRSHPAFKRGWAPAVCRLLEIKEINSQKQKAREKDSGNP